MNDEVKESVFISWMWTWVMFTPARVHFTHIHIHFLNHHRIRPSCEIPGARENVCVCSQTMHTHTHRPRGFHPPLVIRTWSVHLLIDCALIRSRVYEAAFKHHEKCLVNMLCSVQPRRDAHSQNSVLKWAERHADMIRHQRLITKHMPVCVSPKSSQ